MVNATRPLRIDTRADWKSAELSARDGWILDLGAEDIAEIDAALQSVKARGIALSAMQMADFPLARFPRIAARALDELETGSGIFLIRGFPAARYAVADLRCIYWALGSHLGTAVTQSRAGDMIGDVRDISNDLNSVRGRGYTSSQDLDFHTDSCDVAGLFVLRDAKQGGISLAASSVAIHNEIARTRPDLLDTLYDTFPHTVPQPEFEDEPPLYHQPIFTWHENHFACKFNHYSINLAQRRPEAPRLGPRQTEALVLFRTLAADPQFTYQTKLRTGDIQLVNNHVTLHARTEFEDYEEADRKRHLLRLWLSVPNGRPLSPLLAKFFRDGRPGAIRGGYPSKAPQPRYETPVSG
ncbi:MAG: taurine catabolism dioxygenase TauD [Betaproteobacteria bacterium]|nr:taurine catabolism dioxygenase TauD [Betaproteobacteria bacterium]